ncbi:DNA topoisomerase IV subunit A, partial [Alphaproteobacteria bacterium]|nr:DNA topoisomerase IV subunit A [Alphaproteobacteria bacterium]
QIQKSRLVEKIAEQMQVRKLPMLEDIRDESAADIRLIIEPRNRSIEPDILMETLFANTELEVRIGLNMNVLDAKTVPRVMDLREALQCFLDHRHDVLVRRSENRLAKIVTRLEVLAGYMIVYLNLDDVIAIIREEDEPKKELMMRWKLTDNQAEAILNMRLRSLRKLEEITIREEITALEGEHKSLKKLLRDRAIRWKQIGDEIFDIRKKFGKKTELGIRRTEIGAVPSATVVPLAAMFECEPITVICSQKGWIRAAKGHLEDAASLKFKEGDRSRFLFHAETTDKLVLLGTNGRFYTIGGEKLPSGRGHGEPLRLMIDLGKDHDVVGLFKHVPGRKLLVASSDGRGFVVLEDEVLAQTRTGKQVLNVSGGSKARICSVVEGDSVAVIGENHKLIIFPLNDLPKMTRGRGVKLQSYKGGGLADAKSFILTEGLSWKSGDRIRTEFDLLAWIGKRAQAGRLAPKGFPRSNNFG